MFKKYAVPMAPVALTPTQSKLLTASYVAVVAYLTVATIGTARLFYDAYVSEKELREAREQFLDIWE